MTDRNREERTENAADRGLLGDAHNVAERTVDVVRLAGKVYDLMREDVRLARARGAVITRHG